MNNHTTVLNATNIEGRAFFNMWLTSAHIEGIFMNTTGNFFYLLANGHIYYMPKAGSDGCKAGPWGTLDRFLTFIKYNKL